MPNGVPIGQSFAGVGVERTPAIGSRLTGESYDVPRAGFIGIGNSLLESISEPSIAQKAILPEVSLTKKRSKGEPAVSQLDSYFACLAVESEEW